MILVVDFGGQTAHLIGRRLRQLGVLVEYSVPQDALQIIKKTKPKGIIFSGGPNDISHDPSLSIDKKVLLLGIPVLGICYGWQLIAHLLGGLIKHSKKEYGPEEVIFDKQPMIFNVPKKRFSAIMSHGDTVVKLPKNFEPYGKTKHVEYAAVSNEKDKIFGIQFHPEAAHTECGLDILKNFALICDEKLEPTKLDPQKIIDDIKNKVGNKKVIFAVSGGVDSSVGAFLVGKAIGKDLIPVYVESGLMRAGTEKQVKHIFTRLVKSDLVIVDARKRFLTALKGITNPEEKRKIIGKLYVDIFDEEAAKHNDASFLGQGTIYSDVIESQGSKHASRIKSHHNVGGLPENMKLELLEPNRNYYKDEVREIGRLAGLDEDVIMQQPWPGPGHAINIMGEVTEKRLAQVMQADEIVVEEMKKAGLYDEVFECFAVLTGAYSTASKGDGGFYGEVIAVRSINTADLMSVEWTKIPYEVLQKISSRIVNEVPEISRVVYDITTKPPATVRWE